jgi:High potential iron-sulfur protein
MSLSRRAFIENSAIMIASAGISSVAWSDSLPMLSESDPVATGLGYKADASTVDKAKFPQYAAGQTCSNCALYQGAAGSSSGACAIYAGKAVSAKGWCASYSKKG